MVLRAKPEKVEERERTRRALLQATLQLAAQHGFAGLGLREVSRGAQIAPTSFYRHFADMEELGIALVDELVAPLLSHWLAQIQAALRARAEPVAALLAHGAEVRRADRDLLRFLLAERVGAMRTCRVALRRELTKVAEGLCEALSARTAHAVSPDVAEAAITLLLEGLSLALETEEGPASEAPQRQIMHKLERQLSLLLAAPAEPSGKGS